jgi:hypothetical protein
MKNDIPDNVTKALKDCNIKAKDAVWDCHGTWVMNHKSLEKVAVFYDIKFDLPKVIESNAKDRIAVILVTGHKGDLSEWSFGEASPTNSKNGYPYAMAEKRAKDRVILKLLGLHGDLYSEEEADSFKASKKVLKKQPKSEKVEDNKTPTQRRNDTINHAFEQLDKAKKEGDSELATTIWEWAEENEYIQVLDRHIKLFGE